MYFSISRKIVHLTSFPHEVHPGVRFLAKSSRHFISDNLRHSFTKGTNTSVRKGAVTKLACMFIYLGFYVAFNTVQVISRRVVGRAEETSTTVR